MNLTEILKSAHIKPKEFLALACALAVGLLFLVFWLFKPQADVDFKPEIENLTDTIRTHFQRNIDYHGLNTAYVIKNALAPKEMVRVDKLFGKSKSEVLVGKDMKGSTVLVFEKNFAVTYLNLNKKNCVALLTTEFEASSGLEGISVSNGNLYELTYGGKFSLPVNRQDAQKYCKAKNTVMLVFE